MNFYKKVLKDIKSEKNLADLILEYPEESFFLEYKRCQLEDYSQAKSIKGNDDLKNITRAICGFGNSEGGILVFGVSEKDNKKELEPFLGYENFSELIHETVSRTTNPTHSQILTHKIESNQQGMGYVIIEIPQANNRPLQTIERSGSYRYLYRSGESFHDMPHDVIMGLLGVNKPIRLVNFFEYDNGSSSEKKVSFNLRLINQSSVIAKNIWFTFNRGNYGNIELDKGILSNYSEFKGYTMWNNYYYTISEDAFMVPPGGVSPGPSIIFVDDESNFDKDKDYEFSFSWGCVGSVVNEFEAKFKGSELIEHIKNNGFNDKLMEFFKEKNIKTYD